MTSGVSWNEPGPNPEAQRGAGNAARRVGLSSGRSSSGSISARLEELSQRIGGLGGGVAAAPVTPSVRGARLSETVARLNARLAQRLTALDAAVSAKNATRVRTVATGLLDDVDLVERTY